MFCERMKYIKTYERKNWTCRVTKVFGCGFDIDLSYSVHSGDVYFLCTSSTPEGNCLHPLKKKKEIWECWELKRDQSLCVCAGATDGVSTAVQSQMGEGGGTQVSHPEQTTCIISIWGLAYWPCVSVTLCISKKTLTFKFDTSQVKNAWLRAENDVRLDHKNAPEHIIKWMDE